MMENRQRAIDHKELFAELIQTSLEVMEVMLQIKWHNTRKLPRKKKKAKRKEIISLVEQFKSDFKSNFQKNSIVEDGEA